MSWGWSGQGRGLQADLRKARRMVPDARPPMENGQRMPDELFTPWFKASTVGENVRLLVERSDSRDSVMERLIEAVTDSLVDLEVIDRMGGFEKNLSQN